MFTIPMLPTSECLLSAFSHQKAASPHRPPIILHLAILAKWRNVTGISQYGPVAKGRPAWNVGKQVGAKRVLKVKQIWLIRFFLDREGRMRDRALFDFAIDSKLRGCDLIKMKIGSLVSGPAIRA
ncbi:hypothetical protein QFZ88_001481 [Mesorhizobium sp. YL-MeA3-2017]|nr:hypothetical protein [Mesorhizobium sp. YL-MeA3-2017]